MKPLKPYIALCATQGSNLIMVLSVAIKSPGGYRLDHLSVGIEPDNQTPPKLQDLVEYQFSEEPGAPGFILEQDFLMARAQGQEMVTVKSTLRNGASSGSTGLAGGGPKPGNSSSSGHYGDPT